MTVGTNTIAAQREHAGGRDSITASRSFGLLALVCLACLSLFLFFFRLGDRALSSSHEARAAQNGQSILLNNDWLLPQGFDRRVDLQKPPLYYWLVALGGWVDGGDVSAWSVRLPAALSALGCVLLVFWLAARNGRTLAGLLSASVLATFIHFTWLSRVGRIDMVLALTTTLALAGFYLAMQREQRDNPLRWLLLAYVALGLGVLLKGPIGLLLAGVVVLAHCGARWCDTARQNTQSAVVAPHSRMGAGLGLWWGLPLVLSIAAPWYWLANNATRGDLVEVFFWHHNLARGLGGAEELAEYPWWYYGPRLVVDLLPWSPVLVGAAWFYFRHRAWHADPLARFGLVWLIAMTVLLSCFRFKRADYLVPAYPGAALFLGCMLERAWHFQRAGSVSDGGNPGPSLTLPARRKLAATLFFATLAACVIGWGIFVNQEIAGEAKQRAVRELALLTRGQTQSLVLLFRVEPHELAFHLGPPVATIMEWENLDQWLKQAKQVYVIMPKTEARCRHEFLSNGTLQPVIGSEQLTTGDMDRPLVLLRSS